MGTEAQKAIGVISRTKTPQAMKLSEAMKRIRDGHVAQDKKFKLKTSSVFTKVITNARSQRDAEIALMCKRDARGVPFSEKGWRVEVDSQLENRLRYYNTKTGKSHNYAPWDIVSMVNDIPKLEIKPGAMSPIEVAKPRLIQMEMDSTPIRKDAMRRRLADLARSIEEIRAEL